MKVLLLARSTLYSQPGGDTVQIVETAKGLNANGVETEIHLKGESIPFMRFDIVHFFNLGRPADILPYLPQIRVPIVVSTILVEYGKKRYEYVWEYFKTLGRWLNGSDVYPGWLYIQMRHKKAIQLVIDRSRFLITTSAKEAQRIKNNWEVKQTPRTLPLGLSELYLEPFKSQKRSGAIVVGRIEVLKNQKQAIEAANDLNLDLKIIGNPAKNQQGYFQECKKLASKSVSFHSFKTPEELIYDYRKAEYLILPSLFETFGLVALEAWSQGCKLVLSKNIESIDFFSDKAIFFDPNDKDDLKRALEESKEIEIKALSKQDKESLSWPHIVNELMRIYESC